MEISEIHLLDLEEFLVSVGVCVDRITRLEQDMSLCEQSDISSPTAQLASVYMVASIATSERRSVATVDFPGA